MAEQKMDARNAVEKIVKFAGGIENIRGATHCLTRLRLTLADRTAAEDENIRSIPGVLGVVFAGGQYQIVLGRNLWPVFRALAARYPDVIQQEKGAARPCLCGEENTAG